MFPMDGKSQLSKHSLIPTTWILSNFALMYVPMQADCQRYDRPQVLRSSMQQITGTRAWTVFVTRITS